MLLFDLVIQSLMRDRMAPSKLNEIACRVVWMHISFFRLPRGCVHKQSPGCRRSVREARRADIVLQRPATLPTIGLNA